MAHAIFLDCGDVLFDGATSRPQWTNLFGQYFSSRFGGSPEEWMQANLDSFETYIKQYQKIVWSHPELDYNAFQERELPKLITRVFEQMYIKPPSREGCLEIQLAADSWINERVDAAIPGAVEAVQKLCRLGYRLYTCSGVRSSTVRSKLKSAGILELFRQLYGPDLINCPKEGSLFYEKIFMDSGEVAADSIVIDDKTKILDWAAPTGATCIRIGMEDGSGKYTAIESIAELPGLLGDPSDNPEL